MITLAVGDIHTKSWIIERVSKIVKDFDKVVFCGDYADCFGKSPADTIEAWIKLKSLMDSNENVIAVIGNHDFAYVHPEIAGRSSGWDPITYSLINAPENKELKDWLLSLPITVEVDGVTFSHAGVTEEWDGSESVYSLWSEVSPIWARPPSFAGNVTYKNIPQVIGHNPSKAIWQPQDNVWCIDTFSIDMDGNNIGDQTVLVIRDGSIFDIAKL